MKAGVRNIISLKKFFRITESSGDSIKYSLNTPSILMLQNIYVQWLQSIWMKADKNFPVFLNKPKKVTENKLTWGIITSGSPNYDENKIIEHDVNILQPNTKTMLSFELIVAKQDVMQYFIQWQRYRKYWWSSVTTTPSLFGLNEIKNVEKSSDVDIIAKLPWGEQAVENVSMTLADQSDASTARLVCSTSIETALITLMLDGMINSTEEGYLRLHRKIAPFKISFALQYDDNKSKCNLHELAVLLYSKLQSRNISSLLPDFTLSLEEQLKENREIGVVYTAVLSEQTLTNGIFHLMNSSTMLKEETHVADFESYAALICGN